MGSQALHRAAAMAAVPAFGIDLGDFSPMKWLGDAAAVATADGWKGAMVARGSAGRWGVVGACAGRGGGRVGGAAGTAGAGGGCGLVEAAEECVRKGRAPLPALRHVGFGAASQGCFRRGGRRRRGRGECRASRAPRQPGRLFHPDQVAAPGDGGGALVADGFEGGKHNLNSKLKIRN
mgnify:CR=1 FL=1